MATCFTPIRGRRMRVTRVNALGAPIYDTNSFVTTSGFVSVQFSPEIEEGEETTVKTASGDICVSEKACDALKWISVQMEFCQVDPCLFTLINDTWQELRDCVGEVIGWAESHKFSCDTGFALELWTDVTGYTPTIPGATAAYGYMLLPFIVGGTLGEQTVENGAVSFTITGRTKKGSSWGVGPYDVMCNDPVTGACGPLLTPVGPDEPRRIFLTTCPPPAAICGCQPLSNPDGPPTTVLEKPDQPGRMTVTATIATGTTGTFKVAWGDPGPVQDIVPGTPLDHTYSTPGTYSVSIYDANNPQVVTITQVKVPFTGAVVPVLTVAEEPGDPDRRTARATVDNAQPGRTYQVRWETSGAWADLPSSGSPAFSATHKYPAGGTFQVSVRDKADPSKLASKDVTLPFGTGVPVLLTTEAGGDADRRTVRTTVTNPGSGKTYEVQWEAGGAWADLPATHSATHKYPAGDHDMTVRDKAVPANADTDHLTVPYTGPVFTLAGEGSQDHTARVTVTEPAGGATYQVSWDAATETWEDLPTTGSPAHSATHLYATEGVFHVRVRDKANTSSLSSQQITVPIVAPFSAMTESVEEPAPEEATAKKRTK